MSTNIHKGFRLPKHFTQENLNDWVNALRVTAQITVECEYVKWFSTRISDILDMTYLYPDQPEKITQILTDKPSDEKPFNAWELAFDYIASRTDPKQSEGIERRLHTSLDITFFFLQGKILAFPVTGSDVLHELVASTPDYISYAYWDSVDKDPLVSMDDWVRRELDWNIAIPGRGNIKSFGFNARLTEQTPLYEFCYDLNKWGDKVLDAIKPRSERIAKRAIDDLINDKCNEYTASCKKNNSEVKLSNVMKISTLVKAGVDSEYKNEIASRIAKMESLIPESYVINDFHQQLAALGS